MWSSVWDQGAKCALPGGELFSRSPVGGLAQQFSTQHEHYGKVPRIFLRMLKTGGWWSG